MTESHVIVRVREIDLHLVESLLDDVQDTYKQATKKDVTVKIDQDNFLPSDSCGGVDLYAGKGIYFKKELTIHLLFEFLINFSKIKINYTLYINSFLGRIKVSNTLETRLELIAQQLIPGIRSALFGSNPNRKFTD